MKGRSTFSSQELKFIRASLKALRRADRSRQKSIRAGLRRLGFYITDFASDQMGFTASDLDDLVDHGVIDVAGHGTGGTIGGQQTDATVSRVTQHSPSIRSARDPAAGGQAEESRHRVTEEWMGDRVETLEDLLRKDLRAVCVGINPSVVSVEVGHYYQGQLGQKHFARLRAVGLLPADTDGFEDDALFENGVGFTDIIKRATARASELRAEEYAHGSATLVEKLEHYKPGVVIFTFKKTAEVPLGSFMGHGEQPSPINGVRYFVMPGPYAARAEVDRGLMDLRELLEAART